ncbi:unnamed protein product [Porites evermanni]|uniref:HECT domain-containing protein n=1 Tax=Porites evermanni TaxID=104178 RepID=A0ABN8LX12_9CNID|nr:unnamed protein product [Porites evermanni]
MEENLRRLSNCLSQASQVVQELAANSGRNVVADATVGETSTSTNRELTNRLLSHDDALPNTSITTVGQAVSRARAIMHQSTTRGLYSRLNSRERLRASSSSNSAPVKSKRAKVESNKVFEFVLLRLDDEDDEELNSDSVHSDSWMLTDESTVLRGFVTLSSEDNEEAIRKALSDAIQMKYPAVASNDLVFLKANRRRITQPVNCHEYSFKQVKSLAGQGAIYLRLKHGFGFLLDNQGSDNSSLKDNDVSNHTERSMPISTLQPPQRPQEGSNHTQSSPLSIPQGSQVSSNHTQCRPVSTLQPTEGPQADLSDQSFLITGQSNENLNAIPVVSFANLEAAVGECISICKKDNVCNPVEILRCAQKLIVQGRPLDVNSPDQPLDGETNFVSIDRFNILESAMEEFKDFQNPRLTLEVSFYGEQAHDAGGPRKEFFRLCLKEIQQKLFENGLRELMAEEYEFAGTIMALSILQNGPTPRFIPEEILQEIFSKDPARPCIAELPKGFMKLGLYEVAMSLPVFLYLLRANESNQLSRRQLILLLRPSFSEEGTNVRKYENDAYAAFSKYVREAASGRRGRITLGSILQFATGMDEEPPLGFELQPSIQFVAANEGIK